MNSEQLFYCCLDPHSYLLDDISTAIDHNSDILHCYIHHLLTLLLTLLGSNDDVDGGRVMAHDEEMCL